MCSGLCSQAVLWGPHTHTHTGSPGINHTLPSPARPSQILISLIMSLLMRAGIPTARLCSAPLALQACGFTQINPLECFHLLAGSTSNTLHPPHPTSYPRWAEEGPRGTGSKRICFRNKARDTLRPQEACHSSDSSPAPLHTHTSLCGCSNEPKPHVC